jgi:hypothetical protein
MNHAPGAVTPLDPEAVSPSCAVLEPYRAGQAPLSGLDTICGVGQNRRERFGRWTGGAMGWRHIATGGQS